MLNVDNDAPRPTGLPTQLVRADDLMRVVVKDVLDLDRCAARLTGIVLPGVEFVACHYEAFVRVPAMAFQRAE